MLWIHIHNTYPSNLSNSVYCKPHQTHTLYVWSTSRYKSKLWYHLNHTKKYNICKLQARKKCYYGNITITNHWKKKRKNSHKKCSTVGVVWWCSTEQYGRKWSHPLLTQLFSHESLSVPHIGVVVRRKHGYQPRRSRLYSLNKSPMPLVASQPPHARHCDFCPDKATACPVFQLHCHLLPRRTKSLGNMTRGKHIRNRQRVYSQLYWLR